MKIKNNYFTHKNKIKNLILEKKTLKTVNFINKYVITRCSMYYDTFAFEWIVMGLKSVDTFFKNEKKTIQQKCIFWGKII